MEFYKYQAAGNDFVVIDDRSEDFEHTNEDLIKNICDRRFGIGADGLLLLRNKAGYDFEMLYFNADGRISSMCGNGGRCIAAFARYLEIFDTKADFLAADGPHHAEYIENTRNIKLSLSPVSEIKVWRDKGYYLNTGSPHLVLLENDLIQFDVVGVGSMLRHHPDFVDQGGTNVNFVALKRNVDSLSSTSENSYFVRTFERGVEDETFACGTGSTAAALAMAFKENPNQEKSFVTNITVLGGNLKVYFDQKGKYFTNIYLEGPAEQVFKGYFDVENSSISSKPLL